MEYETFKRFDLIRGKEITTMGMKLSERAMLVKFSRSSWSARKNDKKVEKEVETAHAAHDAGRYSKILLAKEALEAGQKASNDARSFFYAQTLPYDDEGWRLIPTKNFFPFTEEMRKKISQIEVEDRRFLDSYPQFVEDAKIRLNGLFNEADYPAIEKVTKKFAVSITTNPLPDSSNFPGNLQTIVDDLSADLETRLNEIQAKAMADLWSRLYEAIERISTTLADETAIFRDSLIQNLIDLCALLPRLNLADDPDLERLRKEALDRLTRHTPEELRPKNAKGEWQEEAVRKENRKQTAQDAKTILDSMSAYFTPPAN